MKFLPHAWALRRLNYRLMWLCCLDEAPSDVVLALCRVPSLGSDDSAPAPLGRAGLYAGCTPDPWWVPIALLCSFRRHFGGGCCCLLGRDALPDGAAGCFADHQCSHNMGTQGEDGDVDMVPQSREWRRKLGGASGFCFNVLLKWKTSKCLIMIQYLKGIHGICTLIWCFCVLSG